MCLSIAGWSGWIRYQVFEAAKSGKQKTDFNELLAIRISWDAPLHASEADVAKVSSDRGFIRILRKNWKLFQTSASGCFGIVKATGLGCSLKLANRTLGLQRHHKMNHFDGIDQQQQHSLGPVLKPFQNLEQISDATDLAEKILRAIGLTKNTGRLIVMCGHNSETENNPLKPALDCGACCGHSGESNARYAAAILNHLNSQTGVA